MRPVVIVVLLVCYAAHGQTLIQPDKIPPTLKKLSEERDGDQTLRCQVIPIRPTLNFGFRFQAGYLMRVPMNQYFGNGHTWAVIVKITPEAGDSKPVYLGTRIELPAIPETKLDAEFGGGYFVGEGRYSVEWSLIDNKGRFCRKDWKVEAELSRSERKVQVAMLPHTIADLSLRGAPRAEIAKADIRPVRITVLLNASPFSLRRTRITPNDTLLLIGSLSSLLERLPARSVRLVVFNLDQQTEVFRQDGFSPQSVDNVASAINRLELASVDINVLQKRRGHIDLLVDLINQELTAKELADVVVFLGPASRYWDEVARSEVEKQRDAPPHFFYFRFQPFFRRSVPFPDSIQMAVGRLRGKTLLIYSPGDFAKAIEQIELRVSSK